MICILTHSLKTAFISHILCLYAGVPAGGFFFSSLGFSFFTSVFSGDFSTGFFDAAAASVL